MHFPKRIELWLLVAVVVGGLAWVFLSGGSDEEEKVDGGGTVSTTDTKAPLQLHRCVLKRDHGNARLDIELRVRNDSADKLLMTEPKVTLLTAKGRKVPGYYLPFEPPPEVEPRTTQDLQLRYWLEASDLQGTLTLEVDGKSLAIKGGNAFDLNALKNEEEKVIQPGAW